MQCKLLNPYSVQTEKYIYVVYMLYMMFKNVLIILYYIINNNDVFRDTMMFSVCN